MSLTYLDRLFLIEHLLREIFDLLGFSVRNRTLFQEGPRQQKKGLYYSTVPLLPSINKENSSLKQPVNLKVYHMGTGAPPPGYHHRSKTPSKIPETCTVARSGTS